MKLEKSLELSRISPLDGDPIIDKPNQFEYTTAKNIIYAFVVIKVVISILSVIFIFIFGVASFIP